MSHQPRVWVIRRTVYSWDYLASSPTGRTMWLPVADLLREEMKPHGYRSVVYPSKDDAEAAIVGLALSGETGELTAKPAFGVLSRWVLGSTRTVDIDRLPRPNSRRSLRSG